MTRRLIGAVLVQARASDGHKESWNVIEADGRWQIEGKLNLAIESYRRFKTSVKEIPHHRKRLAYAVKVYSK